jgi:hypothetical protein
MPGRIMPWLLLAAAILIALYYYYGQTPEITFTAPREPMIPTQAIPAPLPAEPPSPSGDATGRELSPTDAMMRDAAAANRRLERDQQSDVGKPSLYPDTMDEDIRKPPPPREKN